MVSQLNFRDEHAFLRACSAGMVRLATENHWMSSVDSQVAGQAFQLGAKWTFDTYCRKTDHADIPSLSNPP